MVEMLRQQGVVSVDTLEEIPSGARVVIRSHGVGRQVLQTLQDRGFEILDATCPFVSRIHDMAAQASREGIPVVVVGEAAHP